MDIKKIQDYLNEHEIDGWLMADFHGRNDIATRFLDLNGQITRRSCFFIPAMGEPVAFVHQVDAGLFQYLDCKKVMFSSYKLLESKLEETLKDYDTIAMEYSPKGRLPYIALVDAGTIELIRSFGCEIVSSADIVANFYARLSPEQIAAHRIAAHNVIEIKDKAFAYIKKSLEKGDTITEYDVVQFVMGQFEEYDMVTDHSPICGVNGNAGNPHYEPTREKTTTIEKNQLILLDLWGKLNHKDGIFGDITWVCFTGKKEDIPEKLSERFALTAQARDAAVEYLRSRIDSQPVFGADVDDVVRKVFTDSGYGENFRHRTGHSITTSIHGPGPNIDNHETEDKRKLQKGHLFSIEPGIYFDDCGFRSEIDVLIGQDGVEITTLPLQEEIVALF